MAINYTPTGMEGALQKIREERQRQREKFPDDRDFEPREWLPILVEEVGEVAQDILENGPGLENELVQVAAVAVAWLEDIEYVRERTKEYARRWNSRQTSTNTAESTAP